MKAKFVKTENTLRFLSALSALQERGASEACLMVVDGEPGLGKTEALDWWATHQDCLFIRAKKEWTPAWMMRDILSELRIIPEHSFEKMYKQAITALMARNMQAVTNDETFAVVVDEVDHIARSQRLMDTLRDMSDSLEIPFIFVGMGKVRHHIQRFPQIASRVGQYVQFERASLEDVAALVSGLCEVEVKPDLVEFLHKMSGGLFREALEGIAAIERFGRRNDGAVGCTEMAGQTLMNDRRSGKPIKVKV